MFEQAKRWAKTIKRDVYAVYLASRDPRVPWYVKALALGVAGYALSPIDLIPDFIPVLGYLDDLILVPLGIWAVVRLIRPDVLEECRAVAMAAAGRPVSVTAAAVIVGIWSAALLFAAWLTWRFVVP